MGTSVRCIQERTREGAYIDTTWRPAREMRTEEGLGVCGRPLSGFMSPTSCNQLSSLIGCPLPSSLR
ncbi:hypothetical protein BS78_09G160900 [Paspalum vaginatum]|nr:hypothetical protein BS78_09G160900 [Paspalum vaginatum]